MQSLVTWLQQAVTPTKHLLVLKSLLQSVESRPVTVCRLSVVSPPASLALYSLTTIPTSCLSVCLSVSHLIRFVGFHSIQVKCLITDLLSSPMNELNDRVFAGLWTYDAYIGVKLRGGRTIQILPLLQILLWWVWIQTKQNYTFNNSRKCEVFDIITYQRGSVGWQKCKLST